VHGINWQPGSWPVCFTVGAKRYSAGAWPPLNTFTVDSILSRTQHCACAAAVAGCLDAPARLACTWLCQPRKASHSGSPAFCSAKKLTQQPFRFLDALGVISYTAVYDVNRRPCSLRNISSFSQVFDCAGLPRPWYSGRQTAQWRH